MIAKDVKFKSLMNPAIAIFAGITYVVPGWHVVPTGTTLAEVQEHWEKETFSDKELEVKPNIYVCEKIISSRTGEEYLVEHNNMYWSCTCAGYSYRGKCKHIEKVKQKYIK